MCRLEENIFHLLVDDDTNCDGDIVDICGALALFVSFSLHHLYYI
jgi:hypothetical protein